MTKATEIAVANQVKCDKKKIIPTVTMIRRLRWNSVRPKGLRRSDRNAKCDGVPR